MSDGPYKSLKMTRSWKEVAKRSEKKSFAASEVAEALPYALQADWRDEVGNALCTRLKAIINSGQSPLFGDSLVPELEAQKMQCKGPLGALLIDYLIIAVTKGLKGDEAIVTAAAEALADRSVRGVRQIEEHYLSESSRKNSIFVRERVENGVKNTDFNSLATRLTSDDADQNRLTLKKKDDVDDGVNLP